MEPPNSGGRPMSAQPKCTAPTLVQQRSSACTCKSEYMRLAEMARRLDIAHSTAWEMVVARQEIPYNRVGPRAIRVLRSDFEAYLEANRYGTRAVS